jgi:hypothetical protein
MQHDVRLRSVARAIYDACYSSKEWSPIGFEEAERFGTIHYRQAVDAALEARALMASRGKQLPLPALFSCGWRSKVPR